MTVTDGVQKSARLRGLPPALHLFGAVNREHHPLWVKRIVAGADAHSVVPRDGEDPPHQRT
jgi:hypothetical protein